MGRGAEILPHPNLAHHQKAPHHPNSSLPLTGDVRGGGQKLTAPIPIKSLHHELKWCLLLHVEFDNISGGFYTLIECCRFDGFYNGHCEVRGVPNGLFLMLYTKFQQKLIGYIILYAYIFRAKSFV